MEKLEWLGYPMVKKIEDTFIRFDITHEHDRQTDRHRMTTEAALMHSIARQKFWDPPPCGEDTAFSTSASHPVAYSGG